MPSSAQNDAPNDVDRDARRDCHRLIGRQELRVGR
jgi:hypothetical protein